MYKSIEKLGYLFEIKYEEEIRDSYTNIDGAVRITGELERINIKDIRVFDRDNKEVDIDPFKYMRFCYIFKRKILRDL